VLSIAGMQKRRLLWKGTITSTKFFFLSNLLKLSFITLDPGLSQDLLIMSIKMDNIKLRILLDSNGSHIPMEKYLFLSIRFGLNATSRILRKRNMRH
jgi:hypothetical protein